MWDSEARHPLPDRVQDPLAELVKIDPKSIGVGQYQHDMNQKKLGEALDGVVEDSVNQCRCRPEYGICAADGAYFRYLKDYREKYCGLSGRKRKVYKSKRTFESVQAWPEGI